MSTRQRKEKRIWVQRFTDIQAPLIQKNRETVSEKSREFEEEIKGFELQTHKEESSDEESVGVEAGLILEAEYNDGLARPAEHPDSALSVDYKATAVRVWRRASSQPRPLSFQAAAQSHCEVVGALSLRLR